MTQLFTVRPTPYDSPSGLKRPAVLINLGNPPGPDRTGRHVALPTRRSAAE